MNNVMSAGLLCRQTLSLNVCMYICTLVFPDLVRKVHQGRETLGDTWCTDTAQEGPPPPPPPSHHAPTDIVISSTTTAAAVVERHPFAADCTSALHDDRQHEKKTIRDRSAHRLRRRQPDRDVPPSTMPHAVAIFGARWTSFCQLATSRSYRTFSSTSAAAAVTRFVA